MKVSAVIVTYNNESMLKDLLNDLLNQTRPVDKIIVVDNASTDGTDWILKNLFPDIKTVWLLENEGSAGGYKKGIICAAAWNTSKN